MADTQSNNPPKLGTKGYGNPYGASGTIITQGYISQEEYNTKLAGQEGRKTFDIMRRSDGTIHAALQAVKLPIQSIDYMIEPASDDPNDVYIADFCNNELFNRNVNFLSFLREVTTLFEFGFSVFEKTYELTEFDGKPRIGIQSIGSRKQRTVLYWETKDGQPGIQQQLITTNRGGKIGLIDIPREKLLIFTNEKEGDNDEGISLLRFAFKDWDMKDKLTLVNAIALEKMGVGVPVLSIPSDADEGEKLKARNSLRQFRANEEAYIEKPSMADGWNVEMLDMKANTTKEILPSIQYHDRQILLSVLAQFLNLGSQGASGSRAVSKDHSDLFMLSEEAAVKNIVATIQKQLIVQLCDLNFTDLPNGYPTLKSGRVSDDSIDSLATAIKDLANAGMITADPSLESWIREGLHAPELPEDLQDPEAYKTAKKPAPTTIPVVEDKTIKVDPKLDPAAKAAVHAARKARNQLIDILVRPDASR